VEKQILGRLQQELDEAESYDPLVEAVDKLQTCALWGLAGAKGGAYGVTKVLGPDAAEFGALGGAVLGCVAGIKLSVPGGPDPDTG
jgi:hypothetical protein